MMSKYLPPHHKKVIAEPAPHNPVKSHSLPARSNFYSRNASPEKKSTVGSSSKNNPPVLKPPLNLDSEHKLILSVTSQATAEVRNLKSSSRLHNIDLPKCKDTASDIMLYSSTRVEDVEDGKDFLQMLKEIELPPMVIYRPEYDDLKTLANQSEKFCDVVPEIEQKLKSTMTDHLAKYCVSFADEEDAGDIKCVQDYENAKKKYSEEIESHLKDIDEIVSEFRERKSPFISGFLEEAPDLYQLIDKTCVAILSVADLMKKWVYQDKVYPGKLSQVVINANSKRNTLAECIQSFKKKRQFAARRQRKLEGFRDRFAERLENEKKERKRIKSSLEITENQIERNENELKKAKAELDDLEDKLKNRKTNSPKFLDILFEDIDRQKAEVTRFEDREKLLNEHLSRLKKAEDEVNAAVKSSEGEVAEYNYDLKEEEDEINRSDKQIQQFLLDMTAAERKANAARKLREYKLDPAYLKKIFYHKMDPLHSDKLNEACLLVSRRIGKSWPDLYQSLPFNPRRDAKRKDEDVEHLYASCLRRDKTLSQQAFESLLKWRILNRQKKANVDQLVRALRKIDKNSLARTLTKQYMQTQSV